MANFDHINVGIIGQLNDFKGDCWQTGQSIAE